MPDPRFLIVRLGSLGDIVHTFPAVAALHRTFPQAHITWLTHPRWESLVASSSLPSEIWATETRSLSSIRAVIARIRAARFTAAIDYQGLWKSAGLPFLGGVPQRIGFSSETIREWGVPILYTDSVHCLTTHIAEQNGELSQRAGARSVVAGFCLRTSPDSDAKVHQLLNESRIDRYVLLSPGGGWRSKCWPPERFGQLAAQIRNHSGRRCVVNYGPGEEDLLQSIKSASGNADPIGCSGNMDELMTLARNAECIVGGDTGPLHLAVALGTPSVSIYGPTDPQRNGPYLTPAPHASPIPGGSPCNQPEKPHRNIVLRAPGAVRDHSRIDVTDPAILKISVNEVFAAVRQLLEPAS